jgi:transcriptional regulator of arginine metabolism
MSTEAHVVTSKTARHQRIAELLSRHPVRSQSELADLLSADGLHVTQGTLSRDLVELDAVRVRDSRGVLVYAVPEEGGDRTPRPAADSAMAGNRLARLCAELLVSAESSANVVVVRTPPGAAQFLASALDKTQLAAALGTIAGDDTVLIITRDPSGGADLARTLVALAGHGDSPHPREAADHGDSTTRGDSTNHGDSTTRGDSTKHGDSTSLRDSPDLSQVSTPNDSTNSSDSTTAVASRPAPTPAPEPTEETS